MGKPKKKKKISVADALLKKYHDPKAPGSLGGVQRFCKAYGLPLKKAKQVLEKDLAYTLHKPRRRRFPKSRVEKSLAPPKASNASDILGSG